MPKNVKKPNPYPAKVKPAVTPKPTRAAIPVPVRKLVQEALDGLSRPGAIPSLVIQDAVLQAFALGAQSKKS